MNDRNLAFGDYAASLSPALYERTPKAVFAAVALSPHHNGGVGLVDTDTPNGALLREWRLQYDQGLLPKRQRPPSDSWCSNHGVVLEQ